MLELVLSAVAGVLLALAWVPEAFGLAIARSPAGEGTLVGQQARVLSGQDGGSGQGWVLVHGERWRARSRAPLAPDALVRVVAVDGLVLEVEPAGARTGRDVRSRLARWRWAPPLLVWAASLAVALAHAGSIAGVLLVCPVVALLCLVVMAGFPGG